MLIYLLYSFIYTVLIYFINIKYIYKIINIIFYDTFNKALILVILIGILIKILLSLKIKNIKKFVNYIPLIIIELVKVIIFRYNYFSIIISLVLSLIFIIMLNKKKYINNTIYKYLIYLIYLFTPISIYIILKILNKNNINKNIMLLPFILYLLLSNNIFSLINVNIINVITYLLLFVFTFNIYKNKLVINKKRNIITIFLLTIYLIYYFYIS